MNDLETLVKKKLQARGFGKAAQWPELVMAVMDIVKEMHDGYKDEAGVQDNGVLGSPACDHRRRGAS